jgi:histidyl-tRNA synthetase
MKNVITSVKGTRDFYPQQMALRNWLYQHMRQVSESFGYQEYEAPFLESIDLYAAKSGDELVKEQSFVFPDRGGNLIALRPELTLSLARMVAQKQHALVFPLRWWSFGPFWRYERPQKGRTREFFQWNIDLIGINNPESDAELVAICALFFQKLGLNPQQVRVLVNDRRLMEAELLRIGINTEKKTQAFKLIDRSNKLNAGDWEAYGLEQGFSPQQLQGLITILNSPDLFRQSPGLMRFFSTLEILGVKEYVAYDAHIVRGLDYYTGIVFEACDATEAGRAILGGGHYDNLVADVGGDPLPGVGFAMGDVVLQLVLQKYGKLPEFNQPPVQILVTVFNEDLFSQSLKLSQILRQAGLQVMHYPEAGKLDKQLKYADRLGIKFALILGPEEVEQDGVILKDLEQKEQRSLPLGELIAELKRVLV